MSYWSLLFLLPIVPAMAAIACVMRSASSRDREQLLAAETLARVRQQHPWNDILGGPMPNFLDIPSTAALLDLHQGHDFKFKIGQRLYSPIGNVHEIIGYEHQFTKEGTVRWGYSLRKEATGAVTFWSEGTIERKMRPLVERPPRRRGLSL